MFKTRGSAALAIVPEPAQTPEEALAAAQAEVARLRQEHRAAIRAYQAAVAAGDGPVMIAERRHVADLDELSAAADVTVLQAEVAHVDDLIATCDTALCKAQAEDAQALDALRAVVAPTWTQDEWARGLPPRSAQRRSQEYAAAQHQQATQAHQTALQRQRAVLVARRDTVADTLRRTIATHSQRLG